jgi:hypothetical protein
VFHVPGSCFGGPRDRQDTVSDSGNCKL